MAAVRCGLASCSYTRGRGCLVPRTAHGVRWSVRVGCVLDNGRRRGGGGGVNWEGRGGRGERGKKMGITGFASHFYQDVEEYGAEKSDASTAKEGAYPGVASSAAGNGCGVGGWSVDELDIEKTLKGSERAGGEGGAGEVTEFRRRNKISHALKGRTSWNAGRKWSPEMRKHISMRTKAAMQRPDVREKLERAMMEKRALTTERNLERERARAEAVRQKRIKDLEAQKMLYEDRHREGYEKFLAREEKIERGLAISARTKPYCTANCIDKNSGFLRLRSARELARKVTGSYNASSAKKGRLSETHKRRISDSIKDKWRDTTYRKSVVTGIRKKLRSERFLAGKLDADAELRARDALIQNATELLRRAEGAASALEQIPNIEESKLAAARAQVEMIKDQLSTIRLDIENARHKQQIDAEIAASEREKGELRE